MDEFDYEDLIPITNVESSQKQKKSKICIVSNKNNAMLKEENSLQKTNTNEKKEIRKDMNEKRNKNNLKVIPLGGLEQIGMNITIFEYKETMIAVDCGIAFPDDATQPGIEAIIPNISYIKENFSKFKGFVITHGHEDHIGALPYILKEINAPIYGTPLTIGLIKYKLNNSHLRNSTTCNIVNFGEKIDFGDIQVEFIKTNHSIVDAAALAITTKIGTIIHTGDFKVDYTPVYDDAIDLGKFAKYGDKGVLALMCDSTNAERIGFTPSEKKVGPIIDSLFYKYKKSRIIIATFASNVDRVQQIVNYANKHNRKVVLEGTSMINIIKVAKNLNKITLPDNVVISENEMENYSDEQLCVIATGSQGENMAALSKMANKTHKKIGITPNDVVILSSHPIPGNEKSISYIIDNLQMQGAEIVMQDTHVSGHACQEEIKLIYSLTKPKYAIPIHGEYRHRLAGLKIALETGINQDNIILIQSGDVVEFKPNKDFSITDKVSCEQVMIDESSHEPINEIVVNDRIRLADSGIVNIIFAFDKNSGIYLNNTQIMTRGFVKINESFDLIDELKEESISTMASYLNHGLLTKNVPIQEIQNKILNYIYTLTKKRPLVIVTIMNVSF